MSQPRYKLTYFDACGLAEPIRLIFAYANIKYEDVRLPMLKLTEERRDELRNKHGYLPNLEIDGEPYTQAFAIGYYLAKKYGLMSDDEFENFRIEEFVDQLRDYFLKWTPLFFESTPQEEKDELKQKMLKVDNPNLMSKFSDILMKNKLNGSPWLVGKKMTWADICLAQFTSNFEISSTYIDLTKNFPTIKELQKSVFKQPGIKEWIGKRQVTDF